MSVENSQAKDRWRVTRSLYDCLYRMNRRIHIETATVIKVITEYVTFCKIMKMSGAAPLMVTVLSALLC